MNTVDDMKTLFEASKVIRKNILQLKQWQFARSFQDFQCPKMLQTFKMHNTRPKTELKSQLRTNMIVFNISSICGIIFVLIKSLKQRSYKSMGL